MFFYIDLLVSTRAVIGHLSGRILLYGPQKFKVGFTTNLFRDLSQSVFHFNSK